MYARERCSHFAQHHVQHVAHTVSLPIGQRKQSTIRDRMLYIFSRELSPCRGRHPGTDSTPHLLPPRKQEALLRHAASVLTQLQQHVVSLGSGHQLGVGG